jgi:DNA-binding response OmpR family regulator
MIKDNTRTIMIIDDDEDDRDFFCLAIRKINSNAKIVCCTSGEDAIDYFESTELTIPDFIFLDLKMPRMDGKETICRLNKIKRAKGCPVIIYSTTRSTTDEAEAKESGARFFLTKPYRFKDLVDSVSSVMKRLDITVVNHS